MTDPVDWKVLEHAHGEASDLEGLLAAVGSEDRQEMLAALRGIRQRIFHQGSLYPATAPAMRALSRSLDRAGGDRTVAVVMLLSDIQASVSRAPESASGDPCASECASTLDGLVPLFRDLRGSADPLVRAWAIHFLSGTAREVPGLAEEELARLEVEEHPAVYLSSAFAVAAARRLDAPLLEKLRSWLELDERRQRAASLLWAFLMGEPRRSEAVSEEVYALLLSWTGGERWGDWEAAPARQVGYFGDLATALLLCGYGRAERTLPALFDLLGKAQRQELIHVAMILLKLFYHSAPYEGDPVASSLTPLQRETLSRLARVERVWEAALYELADTLSQLGLPLDAGSLLAFLGEEGAGLPEPEMRAVEAKDGVVTLDTDLDPAEVVRRLGEGGE